MVARIHRYVVPCGNHQSVSRLNEINSKIFMKAVQLIQTGRPLELREVQVPSIGPADLLVRVKAAGICHSDAHYRAGRSRVHPLPMTLGHEVAGVVERAGEELVGFKPGDRVCLHYMATCGECNYCRAGDDQFCTSGAMIGKSRAGGYAEFIAMPARSAVRLPKEIPFEHGAIMMCSSATALHALKKARIQTGESVAVFGAGGLGFSAIQLAKALGASEVIAVDIQPGKLEMAKGLGAVPVNAAVCDPVREVKRLTGGRGVDVALELIGLPLTMRQTVQSLAIKGRAALAGITEKTFEVAPYDEVLNKEAEIIGVSDHLAQELPLLISMVQKGELDLSKAITRTVPLDAGAINEVLDGLEKSGENVRTVISM
jgi:propanol-preferring alcohol dehydrogenase